ncbi:MAG TPA: 2OG-Fe(II) oxygenase family protein [Crinalium sp.]|jgi:isopenicillin N synthase-like dioxygenase
MKTLTCIPKLPDPTTHNVEFARQLHRALATVGAAYIPVSSVLDDHVLLNTLKTFFALSDAQKRIFAQQLTSPWQGVFLPLGEEQLADDQEDYKEVLDLNLERGTYARWSNRRKAQQTSRHLAVNEADTKVLMQVAQPLFQVFDVFQAQARHVLAAIEMAYHQPVNSLVSQHGKNSTLRLLHYPPAPHLALGSIRLGAHQDYSGLTLLWQDTTGGLEIFTPDHEWVPVDIPRGCIGVIVGEVMQRWSGGTLHGAPHRVRVANAQQLQKARYSIAFFCETNDDCVVYPGSLIHESGVSELDCFNEPIVIEQFLTQKYDQIMENVNF